jgi:hypothetical protein
MKIRTLAVAAIALLGAAPAYAKPPCLRNIDIYSFNAPSDRTLIVETTRHAKYKLTLMGTCWNLDFKERLAFRTIGGSQLSCLSRGDQVISRDLGMRQTCSITNIQEYTPAMQAADKAAKEAKKQKNNSSY